MGCNRQIVLETIDSSADNYYVTIIWVRLDPDSAACSCWIYGQ